MKKLLLSVFTLISGLILAQNQIIVQYEVQPIYNPAEKFPGVQMTILNSNFELITDGNESQFDYVEKLRNDQPKEGNSMTIEMRSDGTLYKNIAENLIIEEANFEGKPYLIKDNLPETDWKISRETKDVAGIQTQKATAVLDDGHKTQLTAWYAPKLNFKNGPDKYGGLPGLILELETRIEYENGGNEGTVYKATKVEVPTKNKKIKKPGKGKEISRADFDKMAVEHYREMMEMYKDGVDKD